MKYTIEGLSQQTLIDHKLDCRDAVFLRWFADFQAGGKMKTHVEGDAVFYWLDHTTVAQELPLMGLGSADAVRRYLKRLVDAGVLQTRAKKLYGPQTVGGTRAFYRVDPALWTALTSDSQSQKSQGYRTERYGTYRTQRYAQTLLQENSSTKNTHTPGFVQSSTVDQPESVRETVAQIAQAVPNPVPAPRSKPTGTMGKSSVPEWSIWTDMHRRIPNMTPDEERYAMRVLAADIRKREAKETRKRPERRCVHCGCVLGSAGVCVNPRCASNAEAVPREQAVHHLHVVKAAAQVPAAVAV